MADLNSQDYIVKSDPHTTFQTICPILVGVAGGSASGKTTLCNRIISSIGLKSCTVLSLDSFYKGVPMDKAKDYNFDHPDSLDFDLCYEVIKQLLIRQETAVPIYDFKTHSRLQETQKVIPGDMILFEGILALHDPRIVALMNLKIFVDCDDDIRLYRRLLRDVKERGREVSGILYQYNKFVKPAFDDFIGPSLKWANIIVPGNRDNTVAINFIVQNLKNQLQRLEELKKNMNSNFYYIDILDSCWLNVEDGRHRDSNELALYQSNKILFLRDQNDKTECINVFKLFSSRFSRTLYQLSMIRFLNYAVKMMKKYVPKKHAKEHKQLATIYYLKPLSQIEDGLEKINAVGIIVPFLYDQTLDEVHKKIDRLLELKKDLKIFVLSIFATMNIMTKLTIHRDNIYMINVLCIVDMQSLLNMLQENCKVKDFDFVTNGDFINLVEEASRKEISRKDTLTDV